MLTEQDLRQFTGTNGYYRWSILSPNMFLTDGAKYVAETAGAFWLMDTIASHQKQAQQETDGFQVWKLKVDIHHSAVLSLEDGNYNVKITQKFEYTDFPLEEIMLFCAPSGEKQWVIYLPSEH